MIQGGLAALNNFRFKPGGPEGLSPKGVNQIWTLSMASVLAIDLLPWWVTLPGASSPGAYHTRQGRFIFG